MKATIIYFSSSGRTKQVADLLAECLRGRGCRVLLTSLEEADYSDLTEAQLVLFGSPAWSGERAVQPLVDFVNESITRLRGKKVAFFGSYDWGDGQYFESLLDQLRRSGLDVHETALLSKQDGEPLKAEAAEEFLAELAPGKA
jgi:flavodoxin I